MFNISIILYKDFSTLKTNGDNKTNYI